MRNGNARSTDFLALFASAADMHSSSGITAVTASVPNLFYNIQEPYNVGYLAYRNALDAKYTLLPITVPEGSYNDITFEAVLQTAIRVHYAAATVAINVTTGNVTINLQTINSALAVYLVGSEMISDGGVRSATIFSNPIADSTLTYHYNLAYYMGGPVHQDFYQLLFIGVPATYDALLPNPINLAGPTTVYIISADIASGNALHSGTGGAVNLITSIDLTQTPYGGTATTHTASSDLRRIEFASPRTLSSVRVQLVDDLYNELKLPENANVSVDMQLHKFDNY